MARGAQAKSKVEQIISTAFKDNFLGVYDKKLYVQAEENGEMVQIAISLTCPKTPVVISDKPLVFDDKLDFEAGTTVIPHPQIQSEISDEERQTVKELMERLGL